MLKRFIYLSSSFTLFLSSQILSFDTNENLNELAYMDMEQDNDDDDEDDDESPTEESKPEIATHTAKKKRKNYFTGVYIGPDVSYGLLTTGDKINYNLQGVSSHLKYNSSAFQYDFGGRIGLGLDLFNVIYIGLDFTAHLVYGNIQRNGTTTAIGETFQYNIDFKEKWRYNPSLQFGFNLNDKTINYGIGGYEWASFELESTYLLSNKVKHKEILSGFFGGGGIGVALGRHIQIRFETTKTFMDTFYTTKTNKTGGQIKYEIKPREFSSNLSLLYRF